MHFLKRKFFVNSLIVNNQNLLKCTQNRLYNSSPKEKPSESFSKSNENSEKSLNVAVIGMPNAGKSTFINNLISHRVCPTSRKVHTTRNISKAIHTFQDNQLILFDTPGLVTKQEVKKHHLENSFQSSPKTSMKQADIIAVIHDVSNRWTRNELNPSVIESLEAHSKIPSFLVLNKIDCLKSKRVLLELVRILTNDTHKQGKKLPKGDHASEESEVENIPKKVVGWSYFSAIFMASAITGDGLHGVMSFLLKQSKPKTWDYSATDFTDERPEDLIVASVRARLLDFLPQEIPYLLKSEIEYFAEENGTIYTSVLVTCPTSRIENLMCGVDNGKLRQITERVTSDLIETFKKPISLTISTIASKKKSNT
ncbi:ERAL1 family protein [Megaselia abdita]